MANKCEQLSLLLNKVKSCRLCQQYLPYEPLPIVQASINCKVLIAGQAPGRKTHEKGVPFDDASGDRLRDWLGIGRQVFYDEQQLAIIPMGFCFPGTGKSGDLPPRRECSDTWRQPLMELLPNIKLTLVIGQYAQNWHLFEKRSVTEHVQNWQRYIAQGIIALPHPSPRNNRWLKNNPWFEQELLPELKLQVRAALQK